MKYLLTQQDFFSQRKHYMKNYAIDVCLIETLDLTKDIFEAFKYLKDCLKCVYHRLLLIGGEGGGEYTKINKNKKMSYISYTVYSCHLEQKFRFLQHEKPDNLKLLAISKSRTFFGPLKVEDNGSRMYLFIYLVTYSVTYRSWKNI